MVINSFIGGVKRKLKRCLPLVLRTTQDKHFSRMMVNADYRSLKGLRLFCNVEK